SKSGCVEGWNHPSGSRPPVPPRTLIVKGSGSFPASRYPYRIGMISVPPSVASMTFWRRGEGFMGVRGLLLLGVFGPVGTTRPPLGGRRTGAQMDLVQLGPSLARGTDEMVSGEGHGCTRRRSRAPGTTLYLSTVPT